MLDYKDVTSIMLALELRYCQSMPTLNLVKLMNELKGMFLHHFTWASNPDRYQIIINTLRAK